MNKTICVEVIINNYYNNNSQITKVHNNYIKNYYTDNKFKSLILLWKFIIRSIWLGISETIRFILKIKYSNNFNFNFKRNNSFINNIGNNEINNENNITKKNEQNDPDYKFNTWLAGVIDGDGRFLVSKKGYVSLEIIMNSRDIEVLNLIKEKIGGNIKKRSNSNSHKYKLHDKKGVLLVINRVNGYIRNSNRLLQLSKICNIYDINLEMSGPLVDLYNSGWLAGMIDSEGEIDLNLGSKQILISVTQKNKYLLDELQKVYGGKVLINEKGSLNFKYVIYRKNEILDMLDNYFNKYPLRSVKKNRLLLIKDVYSLLNYKDIEGYSKLREIVTRWEYFK